MAYTRKHPIAHDCPHTRKSNGVILLSQEMVAALSGAVRDPDEWAIVLQGTKSDDGYEITVTDYRLPEQERTGGHVDLSKDSVQTPFSNPKGNDVAVLHSHCDFGARFSSLDVDKLNTRYPASIVVSQSKTALLGFDYQAVGKVTLPCGGKGEIDFYIQPVGGPQLATIQRVTHDEENLGDCIRFQNVAEGPWQVQWKGDCGLVEPKVAPRPAAFGVSNDLLNVVAKLPREMKDIRQHNIGFTQRREAVGWVCPTDGMQLYWSTIKNGEMYCDKCNSYFTVPGEVKKEEVVNISDMVYCESCEDWVADGVNCCKVCEAGYCASCTTYHDGSCFGGPQGTLAELVGV
jgi:proteasome lid subunit RPN8/RPN11